MRWTMGLGDAASIARATHRPILISSFDLHCYWCGQFEGYVFSNPGVRNAIDGTVPVRLLTTDLRQSELLDSIGIHSHNMIGFTDSKLQLVHLVPGYVGPEVVIRQIKIGADLAQNIDRYIAAAPKSKQSRPYLAIAFRAVAKQDPKSARSAIAQAVKLDPKERDPWFPDAYSALGDLEQTQRRFDLAIANFEKVSIRTPSSEQKAYALISIASCHIANREPNKAKPVLQKLVRLNLGPANFRADGMQMLAGLSRTPGRPQMPRE